MIHLTVFEDWNAETTCFCGQLVEALELGDKAVDVDGADETWMEALDTDEMCSECQETMEGMN